jgi:hypothetical protein
VIGVSLISGGIVSWVTVAAVFLFNIPEGLSSAAGMKQAGRSFRYIFGVWGATDYRLRIPRCSCSQQVRRLASAPLLLVGSIAVAIAHQW